MRRLKGFFALFPDFKKVRSSTASAEMTRQVEISTLSAHQMAHTGVVAHTSSWTPAAYELEESSPPLDSHIGGLPEAPDKKKGVKGQGCVHSGSDRWQRRRVPGRCNKYWTRGLPRVSSGPCCPPFSLVLHFVTDSRMFWVFGSLFQRRCGAPLASCCGSGNVHLFRRCGVSSASCCGSGNLSSFFFLSYSAGVLYKASCSNLVVPFTIGYGDQTLGGHCCFRRHLAELTFDTSGSKTVVTEILALRGGVLLLEEYFESSRLHKSPWRIYLALSLSTSRNRVLHHEIVHWLSKQTVSHSAREQAFRSRRSCRCRPQSGIGLHSLVAGVLSANSTARQLSNDLSLEGSESRVLATFGVGYSNVHVFTPGCSWVRRVTPSVRGGTTMFQGIGVRGTLAFEFPDGNLITVGAMRFRGEEVLLQPSFFYQCDGDIRKALFADGNMFTVGAKCPVSLQRGRLSEMSYKTRAFTSLLYDTAQLTRKVQAFPLRGGVIPALLRCWKETTAYNNDVYLLPKELLNLVASLVPSRYRCWRSLYCSGALLVSGST